MNEEVKFSEFLNFSSGDLAARASTVSLVGLGENAFGVEKNIKFALNDFISYIGVSINAFVNNGNSFGTTAIIGTNDSNDFYLRTNSNNRVRVKSNGDILFGGVTDASVANYQFAGTGQFRNNVRIYGVGQQSSKVTTGNDYTNLFGNSSTGTMGVGGNLYYSDNWYHNNVAGFSGGGSAIQFGGAYIGFLFASGGTSPATVASPFIMYSDSRFLSQNNWQIGSLGVRYGDIVNSGTSIVRFHSNNNVGIGSTVDAGYKLDVNGTVAVRNDLTIVKNSVNNVISNLEDNNTRYTRITNLGTTGGWNGGLLMSFGVNGGSSSDLFWFNRKGVFGMGSNMGLLVEAPNELQFLVKCASASPSGTYGSSKQKIFTDDYSKYTYTNSKIFTSILIGGMNGTTAPSVDTSANPAATIGWQFHPLSSGWASDMIFSAKDDARVLTEIFRVCGRDLSMGLGVTEPLDKFHMSGNFRLGTAGNKFKVKSGTNASIGSATLVTGTVTVNTTAVSANSIVFLTRVTSGGTVGTLSYTVVAGTSFTINSSSATDTSTIGYIIIDAV